jgi:hypothetical protein
MKRTAGKTFEEIRTLAETGMVKPQWMKIEAETKFYTAIMGGARLLARTWGFSSLPSSRNS